MPEKKQSCPADAAGLSAELGLSPVPQHIEIHNGIFALHKEMLLTLDGSDSRSVGACEELLAAIERKTGEKPQFKQIKDRQQEEIRLTHLESTVGHCALEKGSDREEGYTLQISPGGIIIRGADSAGLFYGTRSLLLLLNSARKTLKCLFINDCPDMKWRGYCPFFGGHYFNKDAANPARYKAMAKNMALAKLNHMGFESEAFADDEALQEFGEFCRANFIEPIPLHPFLCLNDRDVVKYVKASDDEFVALMRPAERAIKLLQPRFLGIAGDELISDYNHINRKSIYKPEHLAERPAHEWLALSLKRIHAYLKERGIRMAMWADTLLSPEQFWGHGCAMNDFTGGSPDNHHLMVDMLPKDILMWDWQYTAGREYPSMDYLLSKGFDVVGCVILTGLSEKAFTEYAHAIGSKKFLGMMSLTWCNKNLDEFCKKEGLLDCGDCFWSASTCAKAHLEYQKFKEILKTPSPLTNIPLGESKVALKGDGKHFALHSAGTIFCSILPEGLGSWPMKELLSDVRFLITTCAGGVFEKCSLKFKLSGESTSTIALASDSSMEQDAFETICELDLGVTEPQIDLADKVKGTNRFCIWIRFGKDQEKKRFIEELEVSSLVNPSREVQKLDSEK